MIDATTREALVNKTPATARQLTET